MQLYVYRFFSFFYCNVILYLLSSLYNQRDYTLLNAIVRIERGQQLTYV